MKPRLNPYTASPETMRPMTALEEHLRADGLDQRLAELVRTRASQINGCAYCIHLHTRDAMRGGETPERLLLLNAWRESPLFDDRERAALEWTEALTLLPETHAPDEAWDGLTGHFTEEEKVKLTLLITTINAWNRVAVGFRYVHRSTSAPAEVS